jgi:selenocysteine lyase/cysteine desulfurase
MTDALLPSDSGVCLKAAVSGEFDDVHLWNSSRAEVAWVQQARRAIPASTNHCYFQTAGAGPSPQAVIKEIQERLRFQNQGPVGPRVASEMERIEPGLRAHLAALFGVETEEIALTHSTSEGISIAAWSLNWSPGDEVVISNQEHPSNVIPWYNLRDRCGIRIREIDLSAGTDLLDEVRKQITSRTRMVSISHVGRNNGRRLRTEHSARLAALLRRRGIRYHLDGAQGPGCVPVDLRALGCDYYSACGHKWLLGPKGTGAFFVRREMLDVTLLSWSGAHSHESMDFEGHYELLPSAARFEYGTRSLAEFAGFDRALTWMECLGWERIYERIQGLMEYAIERTKRYERLGLSSPTDPLDRAGILVLRLRDHCDSQDVYERLRSQENILTSPVRMEGDLRLAIHFFNTKDEIDLALEAIQRHPA